MIAPILLPLTALRNKEIDYEEDYYEKDIEMTDKQFLQIYSGAVKSDGTLKDLIRKVRQEM